MSKLLFGMFSNSLLIHKYIFCLLLFISANTYAERNYNMENIPALKTNSVLWGMVAGCVYRFQKYAEITSENDEQLRTKQKLLNSITGSPVEMFKTLKTIGYQSGFIGKDSITLEQWKSMIGEVALYEYEVGDSWLQALGCYKMLSDYKVFD
jgi:hypothetical protein